MMSTSTEAISSHGKKAAIAAACTLCAMTIGLPSHAATVAVTVNVQNLAPGNSVSFAPLRFGFNNGTFDAFNFGQAATAPIISVAEGGSGSAWLPAFAAADPMAVIGSLAAPTGALLPGGSASTTVIVDSAVNPFFTFASMVVPSNDFFIGNDSPTRFRVLDAAGNLLINAIGQKSTDIWDAGSEAFNPLNAAFLAIGNNDLRTPQNGVVNFNFAELAGFDGLTTAASYVFSSGLSATSDIYRISFSVAAVPEPETYALMGGGLLALRWLARRRKATEGGNGGRATA